MSSEPPTDLAPRLEIPYSSDTPCKKWTSWNIMAVVLDSFLRAPTEPGSNELRRAGPRAPVPPVSMLPSIPVPAMLPSSRSHHRSPCHDPFQRLSVLFKGQKPGAGHALVSSGQSWDSSYRAVWGDVKAGLGESIPSVEDGLHQG